MQKNFQEEVLEIIHSDLSDEEKVYELENYHYSDIVDVLEVFVLIPSHDFNIKELFFLFLH